MVCTTHSYMTITPLLVVFTTAVSDRITTYTEIYRPSFLIHLGFGVSRLFFLSFDIITSPHVLSPLCTMTQPNGVFAAETPERESK